MTRNNYLGVDLGNSGTEAEKKTLVQDKEFEAIKIPAQSALQSFEVVLKTAGASVKRDTLDERIINDVRNRTGRFIDVQGGYPHGSPFEITVNAWPALKSGTLPVDTDKDGMPDDWEKKNGLNPLDPSDATGHKLHKQYTNIEVYLNSLLPLPKWH